MSRCLLNSPVTDSSELIVPTDEELSAVFQKDLLMNVFRDGVFGSFRHVSLHSGWLSFYLFMFMSVEMSLFAFNINRILSVIAC